MYIIKQQRALAILTHSRTRARKPDYFLFNIKQCSVQLGYYDRQTSIDGQTVECSLSSFSYLFTSVHAC